MTAKTICLIVQFGMYAVLRYPGRTVPGDGKKKHNYDNDKGDEDNVIFEAPHRNIIKLFAFKWTVF